MLTVTERRRRSRTLPYVIRLEGQARSRTEAATLEAQAFELADDLDQIWPYVAGVPLFPRITTLTIARAPLGWKTNAPRMKRKLPAEGGYVVRERFINRYLVTLPRPPLAAALDLVQAWRGADQVTKHLMGLHLASLREGTPSAALIFLAKALELVRAILPGRTDEQRQRALPPDIQQQLSRSLHWLYSIANQRQEVRHVVKDPTRLELHNTLTREEGRDYRFEGDLVVRAVIAGRLGVPLVFRRRSAA